MLEAAERLFSASIALHDLSCETGCCTKRLHQLIVGERALKGHGRTLAIVRPNNCKLALVARIPNKAPTTHKIEYQTVATQLRLSYRNLLPRLEFLEGGIGWVKSIMLVI